ncbi:hypothetical protein [Facklamia hominis]|uniref:hypothetical protein n=1 Tax=Facklamia hominis TaxID=178214 RepID=UPI0038FD0F70
MQPWEEFKQTYPYGMLQFTTEVGYTGIIRIANMEILCGYVVVPQYHPYFEKSLYNFDDTSLLELEVHGGVTFADYIDKDIYAIGFDCAHAGDYTPKLGVDLFPQTWKDEAFVRNEIEHLAEQLKEKED